MQYTKSKLKTIVEVFKKRALELGLKKQKRRNLPAFLALA